MNTILEKIQKNAYNNPDRIFYKVPRLEREKLKYDQITWKNLQLYSDKIASYLIRHCKTKRPVVVIGHKSPYMPVSFIGCLKAGLAYVPVDISYPEKRIKDIIDTVEPEIVITTEQISFEIERYYININNIHDIISSEEESVCDSENWVADDDVCYIIFTSGSTGKPKGVQITSADLDNFVKWAATIGGDCLNTQSRQLASTTYRRADNVKQPDDVSKFEKNRAFGRSGGVERLISMKMHMYF